MSKTVLAVVAHPGFEVIGCGGIFFRRLAQGDLLSMIFADYGVDS